MKKTSKKEKPPKESFMDGRFQTLYLSCGMSIGMSIGLALGATVLPNISTGMCMGMAIGMSLGIALGSKKDKEIAAQAQVIADILEDDFGCEGVPDDAEVMVTLVLINIDGMENRFRLPDKMANDLNLRVGDRIYIDEKTGKIEKFRRRPDHE